MWLLLKPLRWLNYAARGGVSRAAKGADCKSAASWLRRFESYLPHQPRSEVSPWEGRTARQSRLLAFDGRSPMRV